MNNLKKQDMQIIKWEIVSDKSFYYQFEDYPQSFNSIYNSDEWKLCQEDFGWKNYKWADKTNSKSFIQSFIKFFPLKIGIVWIPGGIIGDIGNIKFLNQSIRKSLNLNYCYIRLRTHEEYDINQDLRFLENNWSRPIFPINSCLTMFLNVEKNNDELLKNFNRSWKRSFQKSRKNKLIFKRISDPKLIAKLYLELKKLKKLKYYQIFTPYQIKTIFKFMKKDLRVFAAYDSRGKILSIRGAICKNNYATDIFAATNKLGKNLSSSHGLFLKLLDSCREYGCKYYDLNGISPNESFGVYLFKKGTGAKPIYLLGEYENSNNKLLSFIINLIIFIRRIK